MTFEDLVLGLWTTRRPVWLVSISAVISFCIHPNPLCVSQCNTTSNSFTCVIIMYHNIYLIELQMGCMCQSYEYLKNLIPCAQNCFISLASNVSYSLYTLLLVYWMPQILLLLHYFLPSYITCISLPPCVLPSSWICSCFSSTPIISLPPSLSFPPS